MNLNPYSGSAFGPGRLGPLSAGPHPAAADTETTKLHAPGLTDAGLVHNPMIAFGALAAVVFGLMAFSTSVRVGKATGTISVGRT